MTIKGSFYVPIFDCHVYVIVSDNMNTIYKNLCRKHEAFVDELGDGSAYCIKFKETYPGHYFMLFNKSDISQNYINHEKSHLLEYILSDCSIKARDEIRAYLDGFISEQIYKVIKKKKIKLH